MVKDGIRGVKGMVIDEKSGERSKIRNNHSLFWIPMQFWGIIFGMLGFLILAQVSMILSVIGLLILGIFIYYEFANVGRSKIKIFLSGRRKIQEEGTGVDKKELKTGTDPVKWKKLDEMNKEELNQYHRRYMPK